MKLTHTIALIGQATHGFPPCTVAVTSCSKISGHVGKGRAETVQWTKLASYEQEFGQRFHLSFFKFPFNSPMFFFLNLGHVRVCPQMVVEKTLQSPHAEGTSCPRLVPPLRLRLAKDAWPQWGVARKSGLSSWDQFLGIFAISSPLSSWWISTHAWNHPTVFEYETI